MEHDDGVINVEGQRSEEVRGVCVCVYVCVYVCEWVKKVPNKTLRPDDELLSDSQREERSHSSPRSL